MHRLARLLVVPTLVMALSSCGMLGDNNEAEDAKNAAKKEKPAIQNEQLVQPVTEQLGTPMAERVATLGFLNKRNGQTRDIELKPGQSIRLGRAIIRLRACERTAPWELTPEVGAFVQLLVNEKPVNSTGADQWRRIFSGWLFRESPSLNVIEHPIYDVWVKSCAMTFPGEEETPGSSSASDGDAKPRAASARTESSAENAPADEAAAAPAEETEEGETAE